MGVRGGTRSRDSSPGDAIEAAAQDAAAEQAGLQGLYNAGILKQGQDPFGTLGYYTEENTSDEGPTTYTRPWINVDGKPYSQITPREYNPAAIEQARQFGIDIAPRYDPERGLLVDANEQAKFVNAFGNKGDFVTRWADSGGLFNLLAGSFLMPTAFADLAAAATTGGTGALTADLMAAGNVPMDAAKIAAVDLGNAGWIDQLGAGAGTPTQGFTPTEGATTPTAETPAPAETATPAPALETPTSTTEATAPASIPEPATTGPYNGYPMPEPTSAPGDTSKQVLGAIKDVVETLKIPFSAASEYIDVISDATSIPRGVITAVLGGAALKTVDAITDKSGSTNAATAAAGGSGKPFVPQKYTYSQTRNPLWGQPGQAYFNQSYTRMAADGGLMSIPRYASGGAAGLGALQEYAAGGKLLRGAGDGMSDSIPAVIRGERPQRAALADGEFVIPADVVSHLGNGSTEAGAKQLYAMMDRIRTARTGRKKQAPAVKAKKYLPA